MTDGITLEQFSDEAKRFLDANAEARGEEKFVWGEGDDSVGILDEKNDEEEAAELVAAKGYLTGSLALSLESSTSRMHRIGRSELLQHEVPELDDLVAAILGVGPDDIARVIDRVFVGSEPVLAAIGPFDDGAFAA